MNDTEKRELIDELRVQAQGFRQNGMLRALRSVNLAADALEETLWRDIDSAPKDGSKVMVSDGDVATIGEWDCEFGNWWSDYLSSDLTDITKWKPLDTPGETLWRDIEDSSERWMSVTSAEYKKRQRAKNMEVSRLAEQAKLNPNPQPIYKGVDEHDA